MPPPADPQPDVLEQETVLLRISLPATSAAPASIPPPKGWQLVGVVHVPVLVTTRLDRTVSVPSLKMPAPRGKQFTEQKAVLSRTTLPDTVRVPALRTPPPRAEQGLTEQVER